ncbi:MAG: MarR family transcriptional regulator [Saprospiraceae bacterium]|jgi:DNA-binding MarR family transcriptional regulator|nr:MarR family transcriptional regulator [Saprospiraceae bacterium]
MTIEEAIEQKRPFSDEYQRCMVNLIFTTNSVQSIVKKHLKDYGITLQQYNVLRILKGAGKPISTSVIRKRLLDKMSDTSRIVERLVQKNLADRLVCSKDKRLVDVSISIEGLKLLDRINLQNIEVRDWFGKLGKEEVHYLNQLLDKIRM